jgi:hypothetical protein
MQGRMQVASSSYRQPGGFCDNGKQNRKGETMHPSLRFGAKTAALVAVFLLVGTAGAEQTKPATPAAVPQVSQMTIFNGPTPTVSYYVQGGSPHLQALAQTLQYTDNELNLTNELQRLRTQIVVNEQTLDTVRTSQALGLGPISTPGYADFCAPPDSALKRALIPGLAREATPAMAYELINLREQVQKELQAEQKKAVPVVLGDPPAGQNAQPAAPVAGPMAVPQPEAPVAATPAVAQQLPTTLVVVQAQADSQPPPITVEQQTLEIEQKVRENQEQMLQGIKQMQQEITMRLQR